MTGEIVFLVLTAFLWVGAFLLGRSFFIAIRLALKPIGIDPEALLKSLAISAGVGGLLLLIGSFMPKDLGRVAEGKWIPIVWIYAPIPGWVMLLGAFMVASKLIQSRTALTSEEGRARLISSGVWAAVAVGGFLWLKGMSGQISILRGALPLHWPMVFGVIGLLVASMLAMVFAEKTTAARGITKRFTAQIVLLVGAAVFSIPFIWLLTTSFKEERDLANADGIVWVPEVQETYAYMDPEKPLYESRYEGRAVKVKKDSDVAGGKWLVEVDRPYGLRGRRFEVPAGSLKEIPRDQMVWSGSMNGSPYTGFAVRENEDGSRLLEVMTPADKKGQRLTVAAEDVEPVRKPGLRWENYTDALEWMPLETGFGLLYLVNTLWLAGMSVVGTVLSCSIVAYGFARLRFPGRDQLFFLMLMTMMLPGAVTALPRFLIFTGLGWMDSLLPLWVPTFFAGAFNVFLLRQFFGTIPMELEEAARIDGCGYWRTFWQIMLPLVKPALAVIAIWTFMGAWNDFMGPLVYVNTPSKMPISYAMALFASDRGTDQALMMAFATMSTVPVLLLFFFAQKYFIEGVSLSGLGGR
ncbi:MAG: carbohydrate ABC transporter permease [Fimbriimonadaceae bacterium]